MPRGRGRGRGRGRKKSVKPRELRAEVPKPIGVSVWAQCDNAGCQKWRKLPPGTVVNDKEPWFCYMNPNEDRNDCNISEESYNAAAEAAVYSNADEDGAESREADAAWTPADEPARRVPSGGYGEAERPADPGWQPGAADRAAEGRDGGGGPPSQQALAQARRVHGGFGRLLAGGGAWGGTGPAAPPDWLWEGLAAHCPAGAQLACQAADAASAAGYFAEAAGGAAQAREADGVARLALTAAAALAARETGRVPGVEQAQPSGSAADGRLDGDPAGRQALPDSSAALLQPGQPGPYGPPGWPVSGAGQAALPFSLAGGLPLSQGGLPGGSLPQSSPGWQPPPFAAQPAGSGAPVGPPFLGWSPPNGAAFPPGPAFAQPAPQFWAAGALASPGQLPGLPPLAGPGGNGLPGAAPGNAVVKGRPA